MIIWPLSIHSNGRDERGRWGFFLAHVFIRPPNFFAPFLCRTGRESDFGGIFRIRSKGRPLRGPTFGREGEAFRNWRRSVRDVGPVSGNKVPSRGDLRFRRYQITLVFQNGRRTCPKTAISGRIFKLFFLDSWSRRGSTEIPKAVWRIPRWPPCQGQNG